MKCPTCGNPMKTVWVNSGRRGVLGCSISETRDCCPYCEWKGTTGPGKQLREIIKQHNEVPNG